MLATTDSDEMNKEEKIERRRNLTMRKEGDCEV
jgi:hypothetical protein